MPSKLNDSGMLFILLVGRREIFLQGNITWKSQSLSTEIDIHSEGIQASSPFILIGFLI